MTVEDYLSGQEDNRQRELVWGIVREPPAPFFADQVVVTRSVVLLSLHVQEHKLGVGACAPSDVILDEEKALVVQPDVYFVSHQRMVLVRDQLWGPPDLVIEVASPGTARFDRVTKLEWYGMYGVRECWLVDPRARAITVIDLQSEAGMAPCRFTGDAPVHSTVLPHFQTAAGEFFRFP
jgi:Uma2 family endonuclease